MREKMCVCVSVYMCVWMESGVVAVGRKATEGLDIYQRCWTFSKGYGKY